MDVIKKELEGNNNSFELSSVKLEIEEIKNESVNVQIYITLFPTDLCMEYYCDFVDIRFFWLFLIRFSPLFLFDIIYSQTNLQWTVFNSFLYLARRR